jgi:hypothetical protein
MTPGNGRIVSAPGHHRAAAVVAGAMLVSSLGLSGCGIGHVVKAVNRVRHDVAANKATVEEFTSSMKSGEATPFEATYVTTGKSPAKVVYAVQPPQNLAFTDTPPGSGASNLDIVVNKSGEYSCSPPATAGSASRWTCQKLGNASAATHNRIFDLYTPAHWITFLRGFSLAAGFAGDSVRSSHLTKNGFSMNCLVFRAAGVRGVSRICTTSQGILGYVAIASDPTRFEITSYSASPSVALFRLPPGARITAQPKSTS